MPKDYYKTLGVEKNASKEEIKKAFHKLAHTHHPDKNNGDDKKFKEVNEAYQVLSDDKKRSSYDQFGNADGPQGFGGAGFGGQGGFGGFDFRGGQNGMEFDMGDLGDIFGDFFGGGRSKAKAHKGRDLQTDITLTFEESIFGVEKKINVNKQSICNVCSGTGAKVGTKMDTCKTCGGQGQVREVRRSILGNFATTKTCENCGGAGKIPSEKCSNCRGAGVLKTNEDISVKIPSGVNNGESLRVRGKGESIKGGESGDLYIKLNVKKHTLYTREDSNLIMDLNIKLTDALLGITYNLKTLDNKNIEVKIPEGINNGEMLRVRGKGVPVGGSRGDIIIRIEVDIPKRLSRKSKELVEELKKEGL
ncbi:MAG: molecular chaperone DnaJ [Candidatus Paceibacterota bacterium]